MLALSRRCGEQIFLNENIELVVLEVHGDKVKLGLIAPREIPIQREEILDKLKEAPDQSISARNQSASG